LHSCSFLRLGSTCFAVKGVIIERSSTNKNKPVVHR
jgi:hypothetical protein